MESHLRPILDKALAGDPLSLEEGYRLIECDGPELDSLVEAAGALRDRFKGRTVTRTRARFFFPSRICAATVAPIARSERALGNRAHGR